MNRTVIKKQAAKNGTVFALVGGMNGFEIWKLCENYCGQVRGGMQKQWRFVQKGMEQQAAELLFSKKVSK